VVTTENRFAKVQAKFLSKYYSGHPDSKNFSVEEPAHTVTPIDHHALTSVSFIHQRNSGNPEQKVISIERPARTITSTGGNQDLVQAKFLSCYSGKKGDQYKNAITLNNPSPTITCFDRLSLVSPKFLARYNGHPNQEVNAVSVNAPAPTLTVKDRLSLVSPKFIDQQFGNGRPAEIDKPLGCLTTRPKYNLVSCQPWLMNTNFSNTGSAITEPAQTITANRKWHYLMNPQFCSAGGSVENPCFTIIARMDKKPPYLVVTESGQIAIEVHDTDTEPMRKIKEFMALYGIIDIKMRMLKILELLRIMGFPEGYVLIGTQAEQKKYIGNAVEVNMARVLCEALVMKLFEIKIFKKVI
jgi:DNA (cytosine-5)-methyltransferase 1